MRWIDFIPEHRWKRLTKSEKELLHNLQSTNLKELDLREV